MFKKLCKEINWNEKQNPYEDVLRTLEKISPPRIFSIYCGGINWLSIIFLMDSFYMFMT